MADAFSLTEKGRFSYGRAVFPSLTFPNITSILTGHSVADHPIIGNRILVEDSVVNFENVASWQELAITLQRKTIFYKLANESQSSVSYSYAFTGGATAFQTTSPEAAVSYLENDYASIDTQTLSSLQSLLTETSPEKWPRFIFVHLIGVDSAAHAYGPIDPRVQAYLHSLDAQLAPIFKVLNHPNGTSVSTHAVNYALTADHGFRTTPDHAPLEEVITHMNRHLKVISDNRAAPVWVEEPMDENAKLKLARALLQVPHVGWAAVRTSDGIDLLRRTGDHARITIAKTVCPTGEHAARFDWVSRADTATTDISPDLKIRDRKIASNSEPTNVFTCLSDFDLATGPDDDSFIVPALVDYFSAAKAPDMVFIPDDHSDFAQGYAGNHGGLTRDEMLVPVLTKDVEMSRGVHPTYELLRTMGLDAASK